MKSFSIIFSFSAGDGLQNLNFTKLTRLDILVASSTIQNLGLEGFKGFIKIFHAVSRRRPRARAVRVLAT